MHRRFLIALALFSFAVASALALAQPAGNNQSSSSSQQSASAPPSETTKPEQAASKSKGKKKPRKVWTNEEMGTLNSTVSVVGDPAAAGARGTATPSGAANSSAAEHYRQQLAPLRRELAEIERQIREVKSLGAQGASYNNTSLDRLEDRKKSVQLKIDAIEEDARRRGIPPGELR